ncbi:MAG: signal recognition particle-docking protein FtsY [Candidatus Nanohaloarchaea archaeon]|nr:signal recognition particle-docking protein FtsY [Candidatus Nanohaloarchaea archaeon]
MFDNLKDSIKDFSSKAKSAVAEKELDEDDVDDMLWEFEMELLQNNVAQDVVDQLIDDLRDDLVGASITRTKVGDYITESVQDAVRDVLRPADVSIQDIADRDEPGLVLFMGFNGSGKTTTIAKVADMLQDDHSVLLAAGDTFRSAAIDQLEEHGDELDLKVISHDYGSDPAAVIYDAKEHAEKESIDIVLADTAGRSHEDANLMDQLDKICRVNEPDMKILVVDALAGNDVVEQAEKYEEIGFDAIVITKIDVDKKGGAALSLGYVTGKPILYLGTGQDYDDLEPFDPDKMAEQLVGE